MTVRVCVCVFVATNNQSRKPLIDKKQNLDFKL